MVSISRWKNSRASISKAAGGIGGVIQLAVALAPVVLVRLLGGDPQAGVLLCDVVPGHDPPDPQLQGRGDGYRPVAQLVQPALQQVDGIDGEDLALPTLPSAAAPPAPDGGPQCR